MTLFNRLRTLERNTEALRREMANRCDVCGSWPEYGTGAHIVVLLNLPPERQGTPLAAAYLRDSRCPECDWFLDEHGRAIAGQGEYLKVVLLDSPQDPTSREELEGLDYLMPGFWQAEQDEEGLVKWVKVRSLAHALD